MSNQVNDMVQESIMEEVSAMTVDQFITALEVNKLEGASTIDSFVADLVMHLFEQRSI